MPKIPTYQARGRVTTDVPSVKSNVQTPIPTIAGQLQSTIARYYVAEKKEEAKVKSAEYENESWNELYNIYDKYKNNYLRLIRDYLNGNSYLENTRFFKNRKII